MAEVGIANVVARSPYVNQVDDLLCNGCETCLDYCQFDALAMNDDAIVQVNSVRCVGCGVCVPQCPSEALGMVLRPEDEVTQVPETIKEWGAIRAADRGINLADVM
jgi:heterodisulfide reductase subunit A-like polyferredoxin